MTDTPSLISSTFFPTFALPFMKPYTDTELFLQIAEGDEKSFEELYHRYLPLVQPVAFQILQNQAAARDIIQDVFLKLWLNRSKLAEVEQPKNYIFRIAYNCCFNHLKRKKLEQKVLSVAGSNEQDSDSLEETLDMHEVRRMVEAGVQALPAQTKLIYHLNRSGGMKVQQIAEELGLSTQTVRNTLTRATKSIREHLEKEGVILPVIIITLAMS